VFWKELAKTAYLRCFNAAQVYGTSNVEYLIKLGFDSRRIWTKRAVADVDLFRRTREVWLRRSSRRVMLFVGRLAPEKNIEFVLETLRLLSYEARGTLLLRFIGYGPLEASLRRRMESLGLSDVVEFAGPCAHSQLPEAYHAADVVLLPSTSEPWGLTVNEGMLCGLPAIVSDRCGCARDLINCDTGWSFNPYDAAGFAQILEKVAAMPLDDLRTMGKNAAELARDYSAENCARIVMDCITRVSSSTGETP
jgi:glycosyltransferase involved in cell wall biosynthesis